MKLTLLCFLIILQSACSTPASQCQGLDDRTSHDEQACNETVNTVNSTGNSVENQQFRDEIIRVLARISGRSEDELRNDPAARQAAEALAITDAAKSYAFTKIYAVSARYCGEEVRNGLDNYMKSAAEIIFLGDYYYTHGIQVEIRGKKISKTGKELTEGLNGMLHKLEQEHQTATPVQLKKKCQQASRSLKMLTALYSR